MIHFGLFSICSEMVRHGFDPAKCLNMLPVKCVNQRGKNYVNV